MQGAAFLVREVITLIVSNQADNGPVGQSCRLVENEPPFFDTCSEGTHVRTVQVSKVLSKSSRCATEPVDLVKPGHDLVPTGRH